MNFLDFPPNDNKHLMLIQSQVGLMDKGTSKHIEIDDRMSMFIECLGDKRYNGWIYYTNGAMPIMTFENATLKQIVADAYEQGAFTNESAGSIYNKMQASALEQAVAQPIDKILNYDNQMLTKDAAIASIDIPSTIAKDQTEVDVGPSPYGTVPCAPTSATIEDVGGGHFMITILKSIAAEIIEKYPDVQAPELVDLIKAQSHKYIKRTGVPGNYKYWYQLPNGHVVSSDSQDGPPHVDHEKKLDTDERHHEKTPADEGAEAARKESGQGAKNLQSEKADYEKELKTTTDKDKKEELEARIEKIDQQLEEHGQESPKESKKEKENSKFKVGSEVVDPKDTVGSYKDVGKVTSVNEDGTLNISYPNGAAYKNVPADKVKAYNNVSSGGDKEGGSKFKENKTIKLGKDSTGKMTHGILRQKVGDKWMVEMDGGGHVTLTENELRASAKESLKDQDSKKDKKEDLKTVREQRQELFDVKDQDKQMVVVTHNDNGESEEMSARDARQLLFKEDNQDGQSKYTIDIKNKKDDSKESNKESAKTTKDVESDKEGMKKFNAIWTFAKEMEKDGASKKEIVSILHKIESDESLSFEDLSYKDYKQEGKPDAVFERFKEKYQEGSAQRDKEKTSKKDVKKSQGDNMEDTFKSFRLGPTVHEHDKEVEFKKSLDETVQAHFDAQSEKLEKSTKLEVFFEEKKDQKIDEILKSDSVNLGDKTKNDVISIIHLEHQFKDKPDTMF